MYDPNLAHAKYLSSQDGESTWGKTAEAHADTLGLTAANDMLAEGTFGTFTEYYNKYKEISIAGASGVATAKINGDFKRELAAHVHSRK